MEEKYKLNEHIGKKEFLYKTVRVIEYLKYLDVRKRDIMIEWEGISYTPWLIETLIKGYADVNLEKYKELLKVVLMILEFDKEYETYIMETVDDVREKGDLGGKTK